MPPARSADHPYRGRRVVIGCGEASVRSFSACYGAIDLFFGVIDNIFKRLYKRRKHRELQKKQITIAAFMRPSTHVDDLFGLFPQSDGMTIYALSRRTIS
jgi:hypothetical protein